jgi:hypothetical protein
MINKQIKFTEEEWAKLNNTMNGIKETTDKLTFDIDFDFIKRMAGRMQRNKDKYPMGNWKKPMDVEELKQALFRHTLEVMDGNYDDEQYYGHLVAVACNAFMITYQLRQNEKPRKISPKEVVATLKERFETAEKLYKNE